MSKVIVFSVGAEGVEPSLCQVLHTRCAVCGSVAPKWRAHIMKH